MSEGDETQGRVARFWQAVADLWLADRKRFGLYVVLVAGAVLTVRFAIPLFGELSRAIDSKDDQTDVRNIGIALVGLFGGVFAVWRGLIAAEQTKVARQQFERSQDRDYADLFTKAVEQLGTTREVREYDEEARREVYRLEPNIEVRLGAIYALERISQNSERDYISVMETLCAYIRENAPAQRCEEYNSTDRNLIDRILALDLPPSDIHGSLKVIGRRNYKSGYDRVINLSSVNIRNANVKNIKLSKAILNGIHMQEGSFLNADFNQSSLFMAKMNNCYLEKSSFNDAMMRETELSGAIISSCDFSNADLTKSNLSNTRLNLSKFDYSNISESDLSEAHGLSNEILNSCFGSYGTILPDYAEHWRPKHWHPEELVNWSKSDHAYRQWKSALKIKERPPWVSEGDWEGWSDS